VPNPNELDDLDRIALEAGGMEADAQAKEDELLNPAPAIDPAETWAALPKMFGGLLQIAMPELAGVYTDAACLQWGGAMQVLAEKHNWDAAGTMSRWAPEIGMIFATLPLAIPTINAIRARRAEAEHAARGKQTLDSGATAAGEGAGTLEPENSPVGPENAPQGGNFVDPD
jgi:hypothetical protein